MDKIFSRNSDQLSYDFYKQKIESVLNSETIIKISKRKVFTLLETKYAQEFLRYRFEVLKKWMSINESYNKDYANNLHYLLNKLELLNYLTSFEREYLVHYEGVIFAKERNLKQLIIDFPLDNKKEIVYYKYENTSMYDYDNKISKLVCENGEFFLTNERIVIFKSFNVYSIYYEQITNFKIAPFGFIVEIDQKKYMFRSEDNYVLYVSFERILRFIGKKI